jgi:membrane associated rhomboid family serine protease
MEFITLALLVITVGVSYWGFNDGSILNKLLLYPKLMKTPSEYYRFITNGFVHADWQHLIFNMITLYFIGNYVESFYVLMGNRNLYLLLYISGIIVAALPSFIKHRNDPYYRSLGASGGTSAVLFSMVYISPWAKITFFFVPMWSFVFAILYVVYSIYMARQTRDNINHDAHLWGAVYGFLFTFLVDPSHGELFLQQIFHPPF